MKVLSLNTWNIQGPWQERWGQIIRGIKLYQPDLIGFQELFNRDWAENKAREAGYPHVFFFSEEAGNVIFSKSKLQATGALRLETRSPTEAYARFVVYAKFMHHGFEMAFFNTHLSWKLDEGDIRKKQIAEVMSFVDEKAHGVDQILVGDFNATSQTSEVQYLMDRGFKDSFVETGNNPDESTWDNRNPFAAGAKHFLPDRRIDYIFYRAENAHLKAQKSQIVLNDPQPIYASDHYGVLTEFK